MLAPVTQDAFNAAYAASLDPSRRALLTMADPDDRMARATQLAYDGLIIDLPIMGFGWDPYLIMSRRVAAPFPWVPSALMPPIDAGGGGWTWNGLPYDPNHPPPGAIKSSIMLADYPPYKA